MYFSTKIIIVCYHFKGSVFPKNNLNRKKANNLIQHVHTYFKPFKLPSLANCFASSLETLKPRDFIARLSSGAQSSLKF